MDEAINILIVDDQLSAREVLRGLLTGQGYNLHLATHGQEALEMAAEIGPDLILLDVMMPGMNGFEVCQQLRANTQLAEVPVIMVTALDDRESRLAGIEAGADDFVSKPFDQLELKARVRTITRLNRYRRLLAERVQRQQAEEEIRRRNKELTLLNQVITQAASTVDVEEALQLACQALTDIFDLPQATALLLNQEQTRFAHIVEYENSNLPAESSSNGDTPAAGQSYFLSEAIPLVGLLAEHLSKHKTPLVIAGEQDDPRLIKVYNLMKQRHIKAMLVIPVMMDDQIIGLFQMKSAERFEFGNQNLTLAQSVSTAVGQTMKTAQLYHNLQRHADKLEEMVVQRTHELQLERDRTQAFLEALGEAVVVTDTKGVIQYLNPAAVNLIGYSPDEAQGKSWHLWQSQRKRAPEAQGPDPSLYEEFLTVVNQGKSWRGEVVNTRKDGTAYDALFTVAPLTLPHVDDKTIGLVTVQRDITLLKAAEQLRMMHKEREKQAALDRLRHTFLSTVNHEMHTPLALIFQTLEMLEEPDMLGQLTEEQLDAIMTLRRQSWILGQMVENLTKAAAFLSKQEPVRPVHAKLQPVFENVVPLAEFKARSKEIEIETHIPPGLPYLRLDVKQMEEVLTQLLDNAIKFNRKGGKIMVEVEADESWITIAISDTGKGIEADQIEVIWQMFEQGTDPLRRAQEGLGLGLVLAGYIVEAHAGRIEVETRPGQGSTFTVKLPRKSKAKVSQPQLA